MKLKKSKASSGFTLVETSVTLLVMTIVIAISATIIIVCGNIFSRNAVLKSAQTIGTGTYDFIADKLKYSTSLIISGNSFDTTSGSYTEKISVSGTGKLIEIERAGVSEEFLNSDNIQGCTVKVEIDDTNLENGYVVLYVEASSGGVAYTCSGTVALLNYTESSEYKIEQTSSYSDLYISYSFAD